METDNSSFSSCTWSKVIFSASCKYVPLAKIFSICLEGPQIPFVSRFYWELNVMDGDSRISHLTWFYGVTQCNFIFYTVHEMQVKLSFHRLSEREGCYYITVYTKYNCKNQANAFQWQNVGKLTSCGIWGCSVMLLFLG